MTNDQRGPGHQSGPPSATNDTPAVELGSRVRPVWVWLGAHDRWFLPGDVRFVAPTVVAISDRLRPGVTIGVWLMRGSSLGIAEA